jgi:PadR family transcriptional regulator PadR
MFSPELKKGSVELMVLALIEDRARHGYEIGKLIETRSGGQIRFNISSLYPVLYRMEEKGWIEGRWVERPGERRRCHYSLSEEGRRVVDRERRTWEAFTAAVNRVLGVSRA